MGEWKRVGAIVYEVQDRKDEYSLPVCEVHLEKYVRLILQAREMQSLLQQTFDLNRHEYRLPEHMDLAGVSDDDPERVKSAAHFEKRLSLQSRIHEVLLAIGG
jgi:hypothetical protein